MLHRIDHSVVIVFFLLGALGSGSPMSGRASTEHPEDLALRFDEIEVLVRSESPRARIIAQELVAVEGARDEATQWSNLSLAYDHEEADAFREWQITLRKRFERPFSNSSLRQGWQERVRSAELEAEQEFQSLLVELKTGYVRLRLLDTDLDRLARLSELVDLASSVAASRHAEGELSGAESQLIQLAAFSVDSAIRRVRQEYRQEASSWHAEMGFPPSVRVNLVTPIRYRAFELEDAALYADMLPERPGYQAQRARAVALGKLAEAARPSLVPGVDIYGGYKRFEPSLDGFAAGIALDLPLFDRKAGAARQLEAQRKIVENQRAIDLARAREEIASLVTAIQEVQPSLAEFSRSFDQQLPLADALLLSYQEGSLTLDAFLHAIQIGSSALESYSDELATYYENLFRLEAMTGGSLVRFAP
jgi:hypothetical protein